jgi:prepilin-type N-terminal cleavage/methylation domain-containing protein
MRKRLRALGREGGYSLVELLVVIIILGIILAGITGLFVSATTAQVDMDRRFQAQQSARLALDKVRREVHCASSVSVSTDSTRVQVTLPAGCPTGDPVSTTTVTWCADGGTSPPYVLRRISGATTTCSGGVSWAEYLYTKAAFALVSPATNSRHLPKLSVDFTVDVTPVDDKARYALQDQIALRNSAR